MTEYDRNNKLLNNRNKELYTVQYASFALHNSIHTDNVPNNVQKKYDNWINQYFLEC